MSVVFEKISASDIFCRDDFIIYYIQEKLINFLYFKIQSPLLKSGIKTAEVCNANFHQNSITKFFSPHYYFVLSLALTLNMLSSSILQVCSNDRENFFLKLGFFPKILFSKIKKFWGKF